MLITNIVEDLDVIFLAIENFGAISLAYGDDVAWVVADQVRHCAYAFSNGKVELSVLSPSVFTLHRGTIGEGADRLALDELCTLIGATPFHVGGANIMVVASLHEDLGDAQAACMQHATVMSSEWVAGYRRDMELAAQFVKGADDATLITLWRPIRSTKLQNTVLHYEAVPQMFDQDGRYRDCDAERDALFRLGMGWIYDLANLMAGIDELHSDPTPCISVQLSPQSLAHGVSGCCARWLPALRRLAASPDVAARPVVEISGNFAGTSIESMMEHIANFRRLGVSLSVANFASTDLNIGALVTLDPDIVKLSSTFMHAAALDPANCRRLQLLFKLAGTMARTVVVDGVDRERHMQIAQVLGSEWVKGRAVGEPAFGRHWKIVPPVQECSPVAAALPSEGTTPRLQAAL